MSPDTRPYWLAQLDHAWRHAPIAWLSGVRRVGKTTLVRQLGDALYVNCDLPSSVRMLADPERFLAAVSAPVVIFDEVHQLDDPSLLLKIAADAFGHLRVVATGSSTLAATAKFRDSLTGRKRLVRLQPVSPWELTRFGVSDLRHRLLRGGLPQPLLAADHDSSFYAEWLDSYFARDVQELFRVEKRRAYLQLTELLLRQSGGLCEMATLGQQVGLSRPTVATYLDALEVTQVVHIVRPFHRGGRQEIVQQPRIYGFDTGFVAHAQGIGELREQDCGALWEHLTLEALLAVPDLAPPQFWRDKAQREVDFVLPQRDGAVDALECKWQADAFEGRGMAAFRALHPLGRNFVVAPDAAPGQVLRRGGVEAAVVTLPGLVRALGVGELFEAGVGR